MSSFSEIFKTFRVSTLILAVILVMMIVWSLMEISRAQQNSRDNQNNPDRQPEVDLALVLAVDCSHSVSNLEFVLQMQGLARAFSSDEIAAAIGGKKIAVMLVQWSSSDNQIISVPWTIISDARTAENLGANISSAPRGALGKTSISAVINFGVRQLETGEFSAQRQVIDISADGVNNDGASVQSARQTALSSGITINGLTILYDVYNLDIYFKQFVTGGPGNFVIKANTYEDYGTAIKRKLLREIGGQIVS